MKVFINEIQIETGEETYLSEIKAKFKNDADVIILNGFPINEDKKLIENDKVILIKKGEVPKNEELESLMVARHTPNVHEKLKCGSVAVLGLGGLGSNIAIYLARIGVGNLILADFDIVEPSNLNRQQYFIKDIGKYKTEALQNQIKDINPFIKVDTVNDFIDETNINKFEEVDIIIEAFDNPKCKANIANNILTNMRDKYLISSSGMAGYYDSNIIQTKKIRERFYL